MPHTKGDMLDNYRQYTYTKKDNKVPQPKRGRPPKENKTVTRSLRLAPDVISRVEAHRERMTTQMPGVTFTQGDAMRALLLLGLDIAEKDRRTASRRRGR